MLSYLQLELNNDAIPLAVFFVAGEALMVEN